MFEINKPGKIYANDCIEKRNLGQGFIFSFSFFFFLNDDFKQIIIMNLRFFFIRNLTVTLTNVK